MTEFPKQASVFIDVGYSSCTGLSSIWEISRGEAFRAAGATYFGAHILRGGNRARAAPGDIPMGHWNCYVLVQDEWEGGTLSSRSPFMGNTGRPSRSS